MSTQLEMINEASAEQDRRIYAWIPRTETAYIQAIIDAYEGIGRVRTERHDGDRSLVLFLVPQSREQEFRELLVELQSEVGAHRIEFI